MRFIRFLLMLLFFVPCMSFAAGTSSFQGASQLLSAARRGDTQTVQLLINSGVDVNFVDSTGLSLVCTAVMNNDVRAIQVLQMYGADASNCDRQIKDYKRKTKQATQGEEFGFFSGLSSSHLLVLSAVGIAGVIGGVALFSKAFDTNNGNAGSSTGGPHGSGGSGSGSNSSGTIWSVGTIPYSPAYLTASGELDTGANVLANLSSWDTESTSALRVADFNYLRRILTVDNMQTSQAILDGVNPLLENYLLDMYGYYALANGYMGQNIFRNDSNVPIKPAINGAQGRPVRVALITGNSINPFGSADSSNTITYAISTSSDSSTPTVDKYLNNSLNNGVKTENSGFDFSGSGSAFNPFASADDSALAKIVAGWEGDRSADGNNNVYGDLYGFVPNGQLAIYRTGNGSVWQNVTGEQTNVGLFTDVDGSGALSSGDTITLGENTYTIYDAIDSVDENQMITISGKSYKVASNSQMFLASCNTSTNCTDVAIYIGTDGYWYVNSSGGNDIDAVYAIDGTNNIYIKKERSSTAVYTNFTAMLDAFSRKYTVQGDPSNTGVDVIANTNVIPVSRHGSYLSVNGFEAFAYRAGMSLSEYYQDQITNYYGVYQEANQGGVANNLFNSYSSSTWLTTPMLVMPAGDYLYQDALTGPVYYESTPTAIFENYAPFIYSGNLNHNFMTIVAVSHSHGNSSATTISGYDNGTSSSFGEYQLSMWSDSSSNVYSSRKCGITGIGNSSVDPWCFAASGPTAEMATAAAAGAVASVKAAFSYMTNDQIFTLLALTADGPYLATYTEPSDASTSSLLPEYPDRLADYLRDLYEFPLEYGDESTMSTDEYLATFKEVFGYGLINLDRAIRPGKSVHYYSDGRIISSPYNAYWRSATTNVHSSSVLSLTGRGAITTSFYDVLQSPDGTLSLPRVWNDTFALDESSRHGLYMGDILGEFDVGTRKAQPKTIGNFEFSMSMSPREYKDNFNGLDNLRVSFVSEDFGIAAEYQRYLTDGQSRFDGRANGVLALAANVVSSDVSYKSGEFSFGARAFSGAITDESLLENDPVVSSQYEPGRLGLVNGGAFDTKYDNDKFTFDLSVGVMHEDNTVLGMYSDGLLYMNGGKTAYMDAIATYKPIDQIKLSARGTFARTSVNEFGGVISSISDMESNAFSFGIDVGGFGLTMAAPLAIINGNMAYSYAEFEVVENDNGYDIAMNNPHIEYVDLSAQKRELRLTTSYKKSLGAMTDAGVEFMYRLNPNNTDVFGNESILMFKVQHRVGI